MMLRRIVSLAAIGAFAATVAACGGVPTKDNPTGLGGGASTATVVVQAAPDVCWSGSIGNATREGCGPASFEVEGMSGIFVANAQKSPFLGHAGVPTDVSQLSGLQQATDEPLTLVLVIDGKEITRNTTTAQYGVVMVSNGK